ncbi:MAG: DUF2206 domain-containing protein [Nitrososphaeria archaeon]
MWSTVFGLSWDYIWGYDINVEYYYADQVLLKGFWDTSITAGANSVASVNLLAPIISLILDTNIISIFKILYPLIFSLVPVILLKAYERLLGQRLWAELSVLFFMFLFTFFTEMMSLARQIIAEVFLALLVYAIMKKMNPLILTIFLLSLSISHYATAYLMMFALITLFPLTITDVKRRISNANIILFCVVTLIWYWHVGGGIEFYYLANIGYQTLLMVDEIFSLQYSQGLAIIMGSTTIIRELAKWINLIAQGLISIGVLTIIYKILGKYEEVKEHLEFYIMSLVFFVYDIAGIALPLFANRLNTTRLYHLTLFFLSPFFIVGGITLGKLVHKVMIRQDVHMLRIQNITKALAIFLVIYFLFNSGFMLEIMHDPQPAQWLDKMHSPSWSTQEIVGAKWVALYKQSNSTIYLGESKFPLFLGLGVRTLSFGKEPEVKDIRNKSILVYLGKETTINGEIQGVYLDAGGFPRSNFLQIRETKLWRQLLDFSVVYASKEALVYNN